MPTSHIVLMIAGMGILAVVFSYICIGAVVLNDRLMEKKEK